MTRADWGMLAFMWAGFFLAKGKGSWYIMAIVSLVFIFFAEALA